MVRYRHAQLGDEYRRLAFAEEFHPALSVHGARYLDLAELGGAGGSFPTPPTEGE